MRFRLTLAAAAIVLVQPAWGQDGGFFGGMADGMRANRDIELQRRALETDRRYGTSTFYDVRRDQQMQGLQRQLDENNRLLRESQDQLERMRRKY